MSTVFALTTLFNAVKDDFESNGVTANVIFGRREPSKTTNQGPGRANRVVFSPGVNGRMGSYGPARNPGRNPRPIATLLEMATVYVWAFDGSAPNDEAVQYEACRLLHDAVVASIYRAAHGTYEISDAAWVVSRTERQFGYECTFTLALQGMIPDLPAEAVTATAEVYYHVDQPVAPAP